MVGENETNYIIDNTLFVVVAGTNDVLNTYFSIPVRRYKYDINAYADLMIQGASTFIQVIKFRLLCYFGLSLEIKYIYMVYV